MDKGSLKGGSRPARQESFVVQRDWQKTPEARGLVNALLGKNKRKSFGDDLAMLKVTPSCMSSPWFCVNVLCHDHISMICSSVCNVVFCSTHAGLLEKPQFEQGSKMYPVLFRRLFLVGKSGVGKTSTVHKLMGRGELGPVNHGLMIAAMQS